MDNEEEAADFLDRLDSNFGFDEIDLTDKIRFERRLDQIFNETKGTFSTQAQVDALFNVADITKVKFPEAGIIKREFTIRNRPQTRFSIKGFRGLFGIGRALEIFQSLK